MTRTPMTGNPMTKALDIEPDEAERIASVIADPESPVGIDAKKTHILILQKLLDIEARLDELERKIERH